MSWTYNGSLNLNNSADQTAANAGAAGSIGAKQAGRRGKDFAARTRANLARADWADYQRMYQPVEDVLLRRATSGYREGVQAAQARALGSMNQQVRIAAEDAQRRMSGLGLDMTPEQRRSFNRQQDVATSLATVEAANRTARNMEQMRGLALSGGGTRGLITGGNRTGGVQ